MATGYEVQMYGNIGRIAQALERIADALSAGTCNYCRQAPADPGYDRCTACRTWRDEEWCENHNHPHGEPI